MVDAKPSPEDADTVPIIPSLSSPSTTIDNEEVAKPPIELADDNEEGDAALSENSDALSTDEGEFPNDDGTDNGGDGCCCPCLFPV